MPVFRRVFLKYTIIDVTTTAPMAATRTIAIHSSWVGSGSGSLATVKTTVSDAPVLPEVSFA